LDWELEGDFDDIVRMREKTGKIRVFTTKALTEGKI